MYGNTLTNGYALDDEFVTGPNNITVKGIKSLPKIFKTFHVNDEAGNVYEYRPIVKVAFAIQHQLFGESLPAAHFINILLYAIGLIILFEFLKTTFNKYNHFILFSVVLIFSFLPIHSEVVASLKNRDVLLSFIFSFSGFITVVKYIDTKKWFYIVLTLFYFAISFLSKFEAVPFLAIIPLVLFKRNSLSIKYIFSVIGVFSLAFVLYKLTKWSLLDKSGGGAVRVFQYFESPLFFEHHIIDKVSATFNSLGFYVKMLLWPSKMACYYGYNVIDVFSFTSLYALTGILCFTGLAYVFFMRFNKPDLLWYGTLFFSASISMYLNFAQPAPGIVADRFAFFASFGFSLMAAYFLFYYKEIPKTTLSYSNLKPYQKIIPGVVFVLFSYIIINRNKEWKSKTVLFETDVKKHPESVKLSLLTTSQLIINISNPEKSKGISDIDKTRKIREAEVLLKNAIKTDSSCGGCCNNLSFIYLTYERNPAEALPYLKLAYKLDTTKKEVICNMGIAYFKLGEVQLAKKYLYLAILHDKKKDFNVPYEVLQDLYSRTDINEGIRFFRSKLEENHNSEAFNVLLGKTYFEAKDTLNSIKYYKEALVINPNNKNVSDFVTNLEVKYHKRDW